VLAEALDEGAQHVRLNRLRPAAEGPHAAEVPSSSLMFGHGARRESESEVRRESDGAAEAMNRIQPK
jgi:hypothetical protein